ncbi:MAG: methyl-accepting chemotaxis protein [Oceanospirillaceae bacterium]|nr:methyl-accepting chemotaxis protein [Oceanospirillaceae bacterium]
MTIKIQFYILISMVTVAVLLLMGVNHYSVLKLIDQSKQRILLGEISNHMLMLRRHEKDFLARNDLKYIDKFKETFEEIMVESADLSQRLEEAGMGVNAIDSAVNQLAIYQEVFVSITEIQKRIGINPKDGLYGELRDSVHSAESMLKDKQQYLLTSNMLTLRRNEKDFMLRLDIKYLTKFENNFSVFERNLAQSSLPASLQAQLTEAMAIYKKDFELLVAGYQQKGLTKTSGLIGELRTAVHNVEEELTALTSQVKEMIQIATVRNEIINSILSLILLGIILAVMILISKAIRKPIDSFSDTINKISISKDLTIRSEIKSNSEIGSMALSFNHMIAEIQVVLQGAIQSSDKVSESAGTMLKAMEKTAGYIEQQQIDNQNISRSIDEILNTTSSVANDALEAENMSAEANEITAKQALQTKNSIVEVRQLASEIENTVVVINELAQESVNIGLVLNVITSVSEQTNLLALNAAIEAARAGEQGRGFSVVADEVRLLAQRSQASTEEIRTIIEKLQARADSVSVAMQLGSEKMSISLKSSEVAGESFESISKFALNIRNINKDIAASAIEQSGVAEMVTSDVEKVFESTKKSVDEVVNSAQISRDLSELSSNLSAQINTFKVA